MKTSKPLLTTTGAAQAAAMPQSTVISLSNRGVVTPQRDSAGRRLFTVVDVATLKAYRADRSGK